MYKKQIISQIVIASQAKKKLECKYIKESRYGLFVCQCPRIIKLAEKLLAGDRVIQECCGIFRKETNINNKNKITNDKKNIGLSGIEWKQKKRLK